MRFLLQQPVSHCPGEITLSAWCGAHTFFAGFQHRPVLHSHPPEQQQSRGAELYPALPLQQHANVSREHSSFTLALMSTVNWQIRD